MKENMNRRLIIIFAAIAVVVGVGCFFAGKLIADSKYKAERDYNIELMKSEFMNIADLSEPIYVTGHRSPDMDTIGSAFGYAYLLNQLGYDAKPVILSDINNETKCVLEKAGLATPELLPDASGLNIVLVDHSEFSQSAEGLTNAHVVAIIDHHAVGTVTTSTAPVYVSKPLGSAATVVWMRYRDFGLKPDAPTAMAMAGSIMSDTKNLLADTSTYADKEALDDLCKIAGITDRDAFYQDMFTASISYEGMTDEDIYFCDYKEYESGNTTYSIACINAYDEEKAADLTARIKAIMPAAKTKAGVDMAFVMINALHDDVSFTWLFTADEVSDAVLAEGFENTAVFEDGVYKLPESVSRKSGVAPIIKDVLESYPQE